MHDRITIDHVSISGFRAYLAEQSFRLRENGRPQSLAVFASNAKGKSSLVDALEFYFSDNGTLERLGQRRLGTQAGIEALRHVRASEAGAVCRVSVTFRGLNNCFGDSREVASSHPPAARTDAANSVIKACKYPRFIIRGYELRRFVEGKTPQERYGELCSWFELAPMLDIQRNLRALRLQVKRELDNPPARAERLRDLRSKTAGAVTDWDEQSIIAWLNTCYLRPLDSRLSLETLDTNDRAYEAIKLQEEKEEKRAGIDVLEGTITAITGIYNELTQDSGEVREAGALINFQHAVQKLQNALNAENQEKIRAEACVFEAVWGAAEKIFEDDTQDLETCPVCETPLDQTPKKGRDGIAAYLKTQLSFLASYRKANLVVRDARANVEMARGNLRSDVARLQALLKAAGYASSHPALSASETYSLALASWSEGRALPDEMILKNIISSVKDELTKKLINLKDAQGKNTYGKALEAIDAFIELKQNFNRTFAVEKQIRGIGYKLSEYEALVASRFRTYLQSLIDSLKDQVNTLYRCIQVEEDAAPEIKLQLEEDHREPKLNVRVNFAPNRENVVPTGYLSDSQIHTLALSLWLAAIRSSNGKFPVIVLDDVVTSYDADHRKAVAGMLATHFSDFQMILVTHDERFFCYLKDHLPQATWKFKRIVNLDPEFGPRFDDQRVTEEMITEKWSRGQSAANEIRQAEEEWLLGKAREFGVSVRIRDVQQAYNYDRGELASAIMAFLRETKVIMPHVSGHANPFLVSLLRGEVENFGSHFQDNPQASASIGDEKKRWNEFKQFVSCFVCAECGCQKFKRPKCGVKRALCDRCETPIKIQVSGDTQAILALQHS